MPEGANLIVTCAPTGSQGYAASVRLEHPSTGRQAFRLDDGQSRRFSFPRGARLTVVRHKRGTGVAIENRTGKMLQVRERVSEDVLDSAIDSGQSYQVTRLGAQVEVLY